MLFSSPISLFLFLPVLFFVYFLADRRFKNIILLIFSLVFYAWGEPVYIIKVNRKGFYKDTGRAILID